MSPHAPLHWHALAPEEALGAAEARIGGLDG